MPSVALPVTQRPRHVLLPPSLNSEAGREAVELAATAGLHLDPWQAFVLEGSLAERTGDHKWAAFEVGLIVPRQNGKGSILEARELAGLFLFEENLILHSAHEFKTAAEAFRRILSLVQNTPDLDKQVHKVRTSHGDEGIELRGGRRLRFVARSTGSGRGFSGDVVILDEAYNLSPDMMAALLPTLSARPNPQLWYTSSAPLVTSDVLRKLCKRGRAGESASLAYFEWSADPALPLDDHSAWLAANPAAMPGGRITEEFIGREREALGDEEFARERLGIWHDDEDGSVINTETWKSLADPESHALDPVCFALDTNPERSHTAIAAVSSREDGKLHVERVEHRAGTGWVVPRLAELVEQWNPAMVVLDPASAAGAFLVPLAEAGVEVTPMSTREVVQACGAFYDDATNNRLRHIDQRELNAAVAGAKQQPVGDAWKWSRKSSAVDISPLVAVTLARWAHTQPSEVDPAANVW